MSLLRICLTEYNMYTLFLKNQGRVFLYMMYEEGERDMLIKINLIIILYI